MKESYPINIHSKNYNNKKKMICPRCDGQGNVYKARIVDLGIIIKICDECEACWKEDQPVALENFNGLTTFLKENNLTYKDAIIEDLEYLEEKI